MTYEFKCSEHGLFEVKQAITAEHHANCPVCGTKAQRVFAQVGVRWDNPQPLYHKDGSYEEKY